MAKNPFPFVRQWRPYLQNGVELNSDLPYPDTRREKTAEAQTDSKFLLVDVCVGRVLRKARYCTIIGQATCTFTGLPFNYALVYSTEPIDFMADIVLWILFLIIDIFFF